MQQPFDAQGAYSPNDPPRTVSGLAQAAFIEGGGAALLAAPTLTWTSDTATATPTFNLDGPIAAGDVIEVQIQISDGDWSSLEQDKTHTVTAPEDVANQATLSFDPLSNATHDARARYTRSGVPSNWSNVETKTINVSTAIDVFLPLLAA